MADYNANIKVNADTRAAEQAIKRLTTELNKIQNVSTAVGGVKNIGEAFVPKQALNKLEKSLQTVANRANTTEKVFARLVEGVGTLGASGAALNGLNSVLKNIATTTGQSAASFSGAARKIDEFAASGDSLRTTLAQVNNLLVDVGHDIARVVVPGFAVMDDTAQATAQTANKLQYALQQFLDSTEGIRVFVNNLGTLEGSAGLATVGLTALAAVVEGQLSEALYDIDASASTALKQLADDAAKGASELQRLIRATHGTVEQYEQLIAKGRERLRTVSAESDEARKAANTITQGQKLLNAELERQNDLLREAKGLRPESVERRATNTYNVTQRRKAFELQQLSDAADAYTNALLNQQQALDAYADSAAQVRQKIEGLGYKGETPALRPAGFTDEDVRVKNLLADQEAAANTIFNIEKEFNKKLHFTELEFVQKELEAEVDKIEAIGAAQKKADSEALKDFDARLKARTKDAEARSKMLAERRKMGENVIIGGAFPLLFGGGPGAVIGGAAGGFIPGNPMLSVATSALGGIFDQFAAGIAELGQALNPLTADIDKIVTASGLAGTQTAKYIKTLEDAGRESDALAIATEELSFIVGRDGVNALREFGEQTQQLTNEWSILTTQVGAALAQLLSGPVGQLLKAVETATALSTAKQSQDPELQRLNKQLSRAGTPFMIGGQTFGGEDRVAIEEKIVERVREIKKEREQELALANAASSVRQVDLNVLQAELELARTDGDLTKEVVYQLQRKLIIQQTNVKLQDAINKKTETETILLEEKVKLQQLEQQRRQALERQEEEYTNKLLNLQKELRNVTLDTYKLNKEIVAFQQGDLAAYKQEIAEADKVLSHKIAILNIEHQLALAEAEKTGTTYQVNELHHIRLQIVREQHKLDIERTKRLATELQLEKDLAKIKGARQVSEAARGITRQIQDVQVSIASPFGSTEAEMLTLRIEQTRRYEDAIRSVNDQIEEQQKLIDAGLDIEGKAATQIGYLQQELALYKQLLPELNAYEQAQLRQKQIIDSLQPAMSGLSAGMTNVVSSLVTGTQTVQQALADMFAQIGQAYISMAAEIITKQLVMITLQTILKALGAVGGGGGAESNASFMDRVGGLDLAGDVKVPNLGPTVTPAFASGGYVTGPTRAIVGEGGESEYIIPASKMAGAMARYSAGARGSNVIPDSSAPSGGGAGGSNTITLETVVINNVEYATVDQVREFSAVAARQGAEGGYNRSMSTLRNSRSQRSRIGLR